MKRKVDFVVEDDEDAEASRKGTDGDVGGGGEVGRAVGTRHRRVAHGSGDDDRGVAGPEQVEREGRFLQRVGALRDDDGIGAFGHGAFDLEREGDDVGKPEIGGGDLAELDRLDVGQGGELRDGGDQGFGGERRRGGAVGAVQRGDGAAGGDNGDLRHQLSPKTVRSGRPLARWKVCSERAIRAGSMARVMKTR